jgi:hypothetical protein
VIATGFGTQRRRRGRATLAGEPAPLADRAPVFDRGDSLEVPSFLREE